jgi:hypothetical protein
MRYAILALVAALAGCSGGHRDDSDPANGRSGLAIYTDNLTGCQYLQAGGDRALTPRMGADGKQICGKGEK